MKEVMNSYKEKEWDSHRLLRQTDFVKPWFSHSLVSSVPHLLPPHCEGKLFKARRVKEVAERGRERARTD